MMKLRRLLRNVPVPRFGAAATLVVLIATSALLVAPVLRAPGWYNVSSLHTALQLLSMAGGPIVAF